MEIIILIIFRIKDDLGHFEDIRSI